MYARAWLSERAIQESLAASKIQTLTTFLPRDKTLFSRLSPFGPARAFNVFIPICNVILQSGRSRNETQNTLRCGPG